MTCETEESERLHKNWKSTECGCDKKLKEPGILRNWQLDEFWKCFN